MYSFFVTGHKGLETLLFHEIRALFQPDQVKSVQIKKVYGGLELRGELETAYRVCLHSRLANRVYLPLKSFKADNEAALYQQVYDLDWAQHLTSRHSFAVSASLSRSTINHSHFAALKVKDAIVDRFRNEGGGRPNIEREQPDLHIHLNIHKNQATLSLDLSGESLHRRGYRLQHSGAPLKENLAAALLAQAGWQADTWREHSLLDPMCGSGTFVIEAAMIAANIPPGLDRSYFGFLNWLKHDAAAWQSCLQQAEQQITADIDCEILGFDRDVKAIEIARDNALRAGVEDLIRFEVSDINQLTSDTVSRNPVIILNPPYGERLQAQQGLASLYQEMGKIFREFCTVFPKTRVHLISANPDLLHRLRLNRIYKKNVNNGPLKCVFASFDHPTGVQSDSSPDTSEATPAAQDLTLESAANALLNRLKKNQRHLAKWAKRNQVDCYRIYDADLPEFAFALDRYGSSLYPGRAWFHLQEYRAPKTIDPVKAEQRIAQARQVIRAYFDLAEADLYCKLRQRQTGRNQYEKQDAQGELFQVREGDAHYLVNLSDYLDTGLFLDHRITRQMVRAQSHDKHVLNLFCYTGTVSIQAALGGAATVTSVDMSATYLDWARENFRLNELVDEQRYRFMREDCLQMLQAPSKSGITRKFDLVFLDPPSFSNSKKMRVTLDIQRDQERLVMQSMALLEPGGTLIFSTNRKGFKLSSKLQQTYKVLDITARTIPEDFKRTPKLHQCWQIWHAD